VLVDRSGLGRVKAVAPSYIGRSKIDRRIIISWWRVVFYGNSKKVYLSVLITQIVVMAVSRITWLMDQR